MSGYSLEEGLTTGNKEPTLEESMAECCPTMTRTQRLYGFVICCGFGYLLTFISTFSLIGGIDADSIRSFVILYVIGNIIALCATAFLMGPKSQCKKMCDKNRRITTCVYFSLMIAVIVCAALALPVGIIILLVLAEMVAGAWYGLSYIPYGRKIVINGCQSTLFKPCPKACEPCEKAVS